MFHKNNTNAVTTKPAANKRNNIPSVITKDVNILGNIVSDGNIDFDGTLNGNIRCASITIRGNGYIKGEIVAINAMVYGRVKGLIRAKNIQLFSTCNVEGIIMHETISIEDGAFVDGKFKRSDKIQTAEDQDEDTDFSFDDASSSDTRILENIRLIR